MTWLLDIDVTLFRWINQDWANRFLDGLMPLMSGKQLLPVGLLVVACMAWKMGRRGLAAIRILLSFFNDRIAAHRRDGDIGEWAATTGWVEEPVASPDGERVAAVVQTDEAVFTYTVPLTIKGVAL